LQQGQTERRSLRSNCFPIGFRPTITKNCGAELSYHTMLGLRAFFGKKSLAGWPPKKRAVGLVGEHLGSSGEWLFPANVNNSNSQPIAASNSATVKA
jgi:hypothetical protein